MALDKDALDSARDAYASYARRLIGTGGSHDKAIAAAIEAYLKDVSRSGSSAKDAFLAFCDPSNWDSDRKKGAYYSGWKDATDAVMDLVMEFWPELARTALPDAPTPPRAPAAETAERQAARRYPLPEGSYHPRSAMGLTAEHNEAGRSAFLAGASWQREQSALSESEREECARLLRRHGP
jgi:hypothetical protein